MIKKKLLPIIKNSESDDITFIIDLKINQNTNEDLNVFVEEITQNVIDKEDFCLEYAYYFQMMEFQLPYMKNTLIVNQQ